MVIINEKICDNAPECGGIAVCPTGAIYWDEKEEKLKTDNDLCVSCRRCVTAEGCPVGAISVTDNAEEYKKIQEEIEADERTKEELFVERYGAAAIDEGIIIEKEHIKEVLSKDKYVFIEEFNDDSIQCLLHSIPIQHLQKKVGVEFEYYKCDIGVSDTSAIVPSLVLYFGDKQLGKIEGYYNDEQMDELVNRMNALIRVS